MESFDHVLIETGVYALASRCFITAVQEGSDAAAKGMKPGDQVVAIEGFRPTRDTHWKLRYAFNVLAPRSAMHLALAGPNGPTREVLVQASVKPLKHVLTFSQDIWDLIRKQENLEQEARVRWVELGNVLIAKIPEFNLEDGKVDQLLGLMRNHQAVVLDLRANPGGSELTLTRLVGGIFDHEIKVADRVGRKDLRPVIAKSRGDHAFSGKIVVLVDSASGSVSELFARTLQLEKRGIVMGDRSSGSVMEAKIFPYNADVEGGFQYAFEVTVSDLIMTDGRSLEHTGVVPDEIILPRPEDLVGNRDPVLAKAVESLGGKLTLEKAGEMFPVIWHNPQ